MVNTFSTCSQGEALGPRLTLGYHACFGPGTPMLCRLHFQVPANDSVRVADIRSELRDELAHRALYGHMERAGPSDAIRLVETRLRR